MSDAKTDAQQKLMHALVKGGEVYRHYKGGLYVVVTTAIDEATLEQLVVYRSCERGTIWVRTMADFTFKLQDPDVFDETIPRFTRIT